MRRPTGYLHEAYARSFAEFGEAVELQSCGGWLLSRPIPGGDAHDAMGCYPLFCCERWDGLADDLEVLRGRSVSVTMVIDPFGAYDEALLDRTFDAVQPFKSHLVTDLACGSEACTSRHHRYYARRALRRVEVTEEREPVGFLDAWCALYGVLVRRHRLTGIKAFSRLAFARQLAVPGARLFVARELDVVVGAHLWYVQGDVAYSHLQAASDRGYELMAAYALYHTALHCLAPAVRWLDLGAGAGDADGATGLTAFKAGWATGRRPTWLCSRVLDSTRYAALSRPVIAGQSAAAAYFPAYRYGEWSSPA